MQRVGVVESIAEISAVYSAIIQFSFDGGRKKNELNC